MSGIYDCGKRRFEWHLSTFILQKNLYMRPLEIFFTNQCLSVTETHCHQDIMHIPHRLKFRKLQRLAFLASFVQDIHRSFDSSSINKAGDEREGDNEIEVSVVRKRLFQRMTVLTTPPSRRNISVSTRCNRKKKNLPQIPLGI